MAEVLKALSDTLAATVEYVSKSVVRVDARRRMGATGLVWSNDGVIVTSNHVVERDDNITVGLPGGQTAPATLVGRDPSSDLAVLRLKDARNGDIPTAPQWGEIADLKVGHIVLAIGRYEAKSMATLGIVSALDDGNRYPAGMQIDHFVQTDVTMYPGFSGGPLVGVTGEVYGMNTSAVMRGVSLTIPTSTIRRVVGSLLAHGKVRRGFLGVGIQPARLPGGMAQYLTQESGLLIMSVEPEGPAEGKLFMGDTIVGIAGRPVRDPEGLIAALAGDVIGKPVTVKILRGGQITEIPITVGERA
jgi:S1-C subfamily serine protease